MSRGPRYSIRRRCCWWAAICCWWRPWATTCATPAATGGGPCRWPWSLSLWWRSPCWWRRVRCARACGSTSARTSSATATTTVRNGCASPPCCPAVPNPSTPPRRSCARWPIWWRVRAACCGCSEGRTPSSCRRHAGICLNRRAASRARPAWRRSGATGPGSSTSTNGAGAPRPTPGWSCRPGWRRSRVAGCSSPCSSARR
mmetsp:Transcript_4370/g.7631  ORF Transcript_4370/g.7631 Transcript_4370/m.7631 type:complete len:201 (-) Transcript_4370:249-851(-)